MEPVAEPQQLDVQSAALWVGAVPAGGLAGASVVRYQEDDQPAIELAPTFFE